ncbi:hypothetical protein CRM22_007315 [Opisthorchis felineus]|uniref:Uncharacterized protein n=1 Tax=Opisthorchis felineus TaxID=147828 RepID=A0A4S2LP77_OPIFE|nr:hypothetical protein CRM22_007315 [Opisthorchis felineus]
MSKPAMQYVRRRFVKASNAVSSTETRPNIFSGKKLDSRSEAANVSQMIILNLTKTSVIPILVMNTGEFFSQTLKSQQVLHYEDRWHVTTSLGVFQTKYYPLGRTMD